LEEPSRDAAVGYGAEPLAEEGVLVADAAGPADRALSAFTAEFAAALGRHRVWSRTMPAGSR
ncbi:MAG TPA: hypothetical protein VFN97_23335, partial [Actinospica sp.]|nr:hypothetical protein [Actinospica sp.]